MELCVGCHTAVRWYHRKGFNSSWHKKCACSWNEGYRTASNFIENLLGRFNLPSSDDLYWVDQPQPQPEHIYINRRKEFREKYNIGIDNLIKINLGD